jgi:hypothetical protein
MLKIASIPNHIDGRIGLADVFEALPLSRARHIEPVLDRGFRIGMLDRFLEQVPLADDVYGSILAKR